MAEGFPGRLLFSPGDRPLLTLKLRRGDDPLRQSDQLIRRFLELQPPQEENNP